MLKIAGILMALAVAVLLIAPSLPLIPIGLLQVIALMVVNLLGAGAMALGFQGMQQRQLEAAERVAKLLKGLD